MPCGKLRSKLEEREEMGDRIKTFLRLRKQNDVVKIICIFVLGCIVFLTSVLEHLGEIYHYINTPAEYILTGEGVVSKKRVDELLACEGVARVSRQMDIPVTVMFRGAKAEVNCTMLSKEYMEEMFQTERLADTRKIYMNKAAVSELQQALWENNESTPDIVSQGETSNESGYAIRYSMAEASDNMGGDGGETATGQYKTAKLMVVPAKEKESFACIADTDNRLLKEAVSIRVQFEHHDLDGLQVEALRKLGYSIDNENVLIEEEYKIQIKLLHIQYGLLCFAICLTGAGVLWRLERRVLNYR